MVEGLMQLWPCLPLTSLIVSGDFFRTLLVFRWYFHWRICWCFGDFRQVGPPLIAGVLCWPRHTAEGTW